ncbi:hypothetical protein B4589_015655 (plasmid) [Halolamina sp. CBA1230]|uniref:hypothetical protein n=1 Tax=Halolamina sp. CBA1230 TaxID=1853690 RepID=UPI0009A1C586|nr:hypothetical protein [Halolamina sp. CBA1230]QKY21852.1 hypothetical protein B4589_015655 [Halolamina sp. CBA1230]
MDPEISETQFSYYVTKELETDRFPFWLSGPVDFPTRYDEGDLGYDVEIPAEKPLRSFFIQYKLSEELTTANTTDEQWEYFGEESFYRFDIKTSSDRTERKQHGILVDLANRRPYTFYVAPEFRKSEVFNSHVNAEQVTANSAFIRCQDAPVPSDDEDHQIGFQTGDNTATLFSSEPYENRLRVLRNAETVLSEITEETEGFTEMSELRSLYRDLRGIVLDDVNIEINANRFEPEDDLLWFSRQQEFFIRTINSRPVFFF